MTLNSELLDKAEAELHIAIDSRIRSYLLQEYSMEPFPVVWTEEYLMQEIARVVEAYESSEWEPVQRSAYERLLVYYERLKKDYLDAVYDVQYLCGVLEENFEDE